MVRANELKLTALDNITPSTIRRIEAFRKKFGEQHLLFAYHAAFPLALTPELLYRLWANFQTDIHDNLLNVPWIAISDLLLSSLCDEVGYELFEMDEQVRQVLLKQLQDSPQFGPQRIHELSTFLLSYVYQNINTLDLDRYDFMQSLKWVALAYVEPNKTAHEIALKLSKLRLEDTAEWIRLSSLLETLAEPLKEFQPLLVYSRSMASFVKGDFKKARNTLKTINDGSNQIDIEQVKLAFPSLLDIGSAKVSSLSALPTTLGALSVILVATISGAVYFGINRNSSSSSLSISADTTVGSLVTSTNKFDKAGLAADPADAVVNIQELQQLLTSAGFYSGPIDGIYGPATKTAVRRAQAAYGLVVDGVPTQSLINALKGIDSQMLIASKSTSTEELQKLLASRGFYNGDINGIYGPETRAAVRDAQAAYGLVVDGIAGPQTIAALKPLPGPRRSTTDSSRVLAVPQPPSRRSTTDSSRVLTVPQPPSRRSTTDSTQSEQDSLDTTSASQQSSAISPRITALRRAIIAEEADIYSKTSGQDISDTSRLVHRHTGALGYGPVIPANVRPWSIEALGYALTPTEFLNSPQLQIQIIDYKLNQYWNRAFNLSGGDERIAVRMVASQWYSGDPRQYNNEKPQFYRGTPYPSIAEYTQSVLTRYYSYLDNSQDTDQTSRQNTPRRNLIQELMSGRQPIVLLSLIAAGIFIWIGIGYWQLRSIDHNR